MIPSGLRISCATALRERADLGEALGMIGARLGARDLVGQIAHTDRSDEQPATEELHHEDANTIEGQRAKKITNASHASDRPPPGVSVGRTRKNTVNPRAENAAVSTA